MKVTLLVMTLNEIEGVQAILHRIPRSLFNQILICDGGSTDGTVEWARENGYEVYVQSRPGLRSGYFEVWPSVTGDVVVSFSPDGNSLVEKLDPLIAKMRQGYDMVIVSRYLEEAQSFDDDLITRFGNWVFRTLINFCFTRGLGWRYTDPMVIYRAVRRDLPERLGLFDPKAYQPMERWFRTTISWEPLMSIRAARVKMRIGEIPGDEPRRIGGRRKLQILRWGASYLGQIVKEYFRPPLAQPEGKGNRREMTESHGANPNEARCTGSQVSLPAPSVITRIYKSLFLIRRAEEEIARVYPTDKIKSPVHLSIGQESVSVGVCDALRPDDVASGTYRGHALYLAKGGDLKRMIAELYGKMTGCTRGKGGSMHLIDPEHYFLGASAVVGTTIPQAVGYAFALKREGKGRLVACFFGDGAVEEGVFYESVNFAALRRLPIIFVCENNFYSIHSPLAHRQATNALCERIRTFGISANRIEEGNVFAIRHQASELAGRIRRGESGPAFLECRTYRWKEHVGPGQDFDAGYRSREEARLWMEGDQLAKTAALLDPAVRKEIEDAVEREVKDAFTFAESSLFPGEEELHGHVFAE